MIGSIKVYTYFGLRLFIIIYQKVLDYFKLLLFWIWVKKFNGTVSGVSPCNRQILESKEYTVSLKFDREG